MMFNLYAIVQDVATSQARFAPYAADIIVLAAMGWVLKTTRDVAHTLARISQYLFGYDGKDGIDSEIRSLRADVDDLLRASERRIGEADRRTRIPPP
jgi:hypothetical protein